MADYVSILKRTLDGLGAAATPTLRERVYGRAREAVQRQLDGMNPAPSDEVVAKQKADLERAIAEVEGAYGEPAPAEPPASTDMAGLADTADTAAPVKPGLANEPAGANSTASPAEPRSATESRPPVAADAASPMQNDVSPNQVSDGGAVAAPERGAAAADTGVVASPDPRPVPPPEPVPPIPAPDPTPDPTEPPAPEPQLSGTDSEPAVSTATPPVVAQTQEEMARAETAEPTADFPPLPRSGLSSFDSLTAAPMARVENEPLDPGATLVTNVAEADPVGGRLADEELPDRPLIGPGGDIVLDPAAAEPTLDAERTPGAGEAQPAGDGAIAATSGLDPSLFDEPAPLGHDRDEPALEEAVPAVAVDGPEPDLLVSGTPALPARVDLASEGTDLSERAVRLDPVDPEPVASSPATAARAPGVLPPVGAEGDAPPRNLPRAAVPLSLDGDPDLRSDAEASASLGSVDASTGAGRDYVSVSEPVAATGGASAAPTSPASAPSATAPTRSKPAARSSKSRGGAMAAVVLVLLLILGGGYVARENIADATGVEGFRTAFGLDELIGSDGTAEVAVDAGEAADDTDATVTVADETTVDDASVTDEPEPGGVVVADGPEKFPQRLGADGEEIDTTPRADDVVTTPVDPTSVAENTTDNGAAEIARLDDTTAPAIETTPATDARAFLVQEPVGNAAPQQGGGDVAWSIVQESPGGDLPPEPAIRGDVALADGTALSLTVKRNADTTLPASHLIEMVFIQPDAGPRIDELPLVGFKDSLQVSARPLIAVPAKITDEFFLVGLNNLATAVQSNLELMGSEDFMDVQLVFDSGRRATLTLEKGESGDEVFADVLSAWADAPLPG